MTAGASEIAHDMPLSAASQRDRTASGVELGVALVLLAVGSAISCVIASAWLTMYVGPVPFPMTVLAAGAWSLFLVRVAASWSDRTIVAAFPALVWILTLIALDMGPGGDMPVPIGLRGLALLAFGGLIPLWVATLGRSLTVDH